METEVKADLVLGGGGQVAGVDHGIDGQVGDLAQGRRFGVEQHGAVEDEAAQFEERVQRQRGHVRLGPTAAALLDVLLELHPPVPNEKVFNQLRSSCPRGQRRLHWLTTD